MNFTFELANVQISLSFSFFLLPHFLGNQCHAGIPHTVIQKEKDDWNGFSKVKEDHKKYWKIVLPVYGKVNRAGHVHSG